MDHYNGPSTTVVTRNGNTITIITTIVVAETAAEASQPKSPAKKPEKRGKKDEDGGAGSGAKKARAV